MSFKDFYFSCLDVLSPIIRIIILSWFLFLVTNNSFVPEFFLIQTIMLVETQNETQILLTKILKKINILLGFYIFKVNVIQNGIKQRISSGPWLWPLAFCLLSSRKLDLDNIKRFLHLYSFLQKLSLCYFAELCRKTFKEEFLLSSKKEQKSS